MTRHRTSRLAFLLLAIAVIATVAGGGCGDSGGSDAATARRVVTAETGLPLLPGSLSQAEYLAQANRICRRSWKDMLTSFARYRAERRASASQRDVFAYSSRNDFLTHIQFWFDDITYLGAPQRHRAQAEAMLNALQQAVLRGQRRRIASPGQLAAIFSRFDRMARRFGLRDCIVSAASFSGQRS